MNCIFCDSTGPFTTREQIIPESLAGLSTGLREKPHSPVNSTVKDLDEFDDRRASDSVKEQRSEAIPLEVSLLEI